MQEFTEEAWGRTKRIELQNWWADFWNWRNHDTKTRKRNKDLQEHDQVYCLYWSSKGGNHKPTYPITYTFLLSHCSYMTCAMYHDFFEMEKIQS